MMGERTVAQDALFYSFSLARRVPLDHLLRSIDPFVELSDRHLIVIIRAGAETARSGQPAAPPPRDTASYSLTMQSNGLLCSHKSESSDWSEQCAQPLLARGPSRASTEYSQRD